MDTVRQHHRLFSFAISTFLSMILLIGCGSQATRPALGDEVIKSADIATQSGSFQAPLDSVPDADATTIYFTASGPDGQGIFRVPAAGGEATAIATGAPFVGPVGIALSSDGQRAFVADAKAGQIFVIPTGGGAATPLSGSEGSAPRGLALVGEGPQEMIYATGVDPQDGQAAVFKLPAAGGTAQIVIKGAPLVAPDGITVTQAGIIYVSDRSAAGGGFGQVFMIDGSTVTPIVERVRVGDPAGIALTKDESVLLVSSLQPDRDSDQVLLIDLKTRQTGTVTQGISANHAAGGVHRAKNSNIFSWADSQVGGRGGVYRIELK